MSALVSLKIIKFTLKIAETRINSYVRTINKWYLFTKRYGTVMRE